MDIHFHVLRQVLGTVRIAASTGMYYGNMEKKLTRSKLSFNIIAKLISHSVFAV